MEASYLAYHGTRFRFRHWNLRRCNAGCAFGRGFYFTSDMDSAVYHSESEHPDIRARRDYFMEKYEGSALPRRKILSRHVGNSSILITAYVTIKRPFYVSEENHHYYSMDVNAIPSFRKWLETEQLFEDCDVDTIYNEMVHRLIDGETGHKIWRGLGKYMAGFQNFGNFLKLLHCDGVIMTHPHNIWPFIYPTEQKHYIVFRPKQVHTVKRVKTTDL